MGLTHQNILGIRITTSSRALILEEIKKGLFRVAKNERHAGKNKEKSCVIVTPNPEQIVLAQQTTWFREMLNRADVALPDGIGIALASQFLQQVTGTTKQSTVRERISGVDFMQDLVKIAEEQRVRIGLIGGLPGVAVKALECLKDRYPRLDGWADEGSELIVDKNGDIEGPGEEYWIAFAKRIISTKTQMVFVGLGAPKQEFVIAKLRSLFLGHSDQIGVHTKNATKNDGMNDPIIFMSVGGAFDMVSGSIQRAPVIIRNVGMEWVWRLFQEPWRWRRQLAIIQFVWMVCKEKIVRR